MHTHTHTHTPWESLHEEFPSPSPPPPPWKHGLYYHCTIVTDEAGLQIYGWNVNYSGDHQWLKNCRGHGCIYLTSFMPHSMVLGACLDFPFMLITWLNFMLGELLSIGIWELINFLATILWVFLTLTGLNPNLRYRFSVSAENGVSSMDMGSIESRLVVALDQFSNKTNPITGTLAGLLVVAVLIILVIIVVFIL